MRVQITGAPADVGTTINRRSVLLQNETNSGSIFVEVGEAATQAESYEWKANSGDLSLDLLGDDKLSLLSPSGDQFVRYIEGASR